MDNVSAGTKYRAKIEDYQLGWVESLETVKVMVSMKVKVGERDFKTFEWEGLTKKKDGTVNANTIKTLVTMGFKGSSAADLAALADGKESGALDIEKIYEVELENNTYTDKSTGEEKSFWRIKWVNEEGGNKFRDVLDRQGAVKVLAGLSLGGAFMEARGSALDKGTTAAPQNKMTAPPLPNFAPTPNETKQSEPPQLDTSEEIPF